ncbi:armadillo-type protein [Chytriomyces sp. MP71]|nr:armadillo-type protein [Chytriomyces sp. MP71]
MENSSSQRVLQQTRINELAAAIIARLATVSTEAQSDILVAGALPYLLALLARPFTPFNKMQEHVLDALGCLVKNNPDSGKKLVAQCVASSASSGDERSVVVLLRFLKEGGQPMTKLLAAACLSNLYRTVPFENQRIPGTLLLPTLIKLFSDGSELLKTDLPLLERSPLVFADLIADDENLQKLALEGDAVSRLAEILLCPEVRGCIGSPSAAFMPGSNAAVVMAVDSEGEENIKAKSLLGKGKTGAAQTSSIADTGVASSKTYERVAESCLLAIAALTSLREDTRKSAIDVNLLPVIVAALGSSRTPLRSAACKCTRSLSRSVKTLRTSLMDAGVVHPLFVLLADASEGVRADACAALCNIVLDFSPMKKTVIEGGGVERIVGTLKGARGVELRVNCVWALKNLLYQAGSDVKEKVMGELGWDELKHLVFDPHVGIQEQSLNLLRNLVCGRVEDIEAVLEGFGEAAFSIFFEKKLGGDLGTRSTELDAVVLQTLYVIVNIATGNERHKRLIIASDSVLRNIFKFMSHEKALIRLATVWCVINLSEPDDAYPKYTRDRLGRLVAFGFQEKLKQMLLDTDPDVQERVIIAIKNLSVADALGVEASQFSGAGAMGQDISVGLGDDMELEGM